MIERGSRGHLCGYVLCALLVWPTTGVSANGNRVLVDASRDGGVWWFPQSSPFSSDRSRTRHPSSNETAGTAIMPPLSCGSTGLN